MVDVAQAWALYAQGDFQAAADLSRELLLGSPSDPDALCCNAMSNWELGADPRRCLADMTRAVELAPREAWLRHNLGTVLASLGYLDEACDNFEQAIALKPEDTQAFYALTQNRKFTEKTELVRRMRSLYASGRLDRNGQEYVCFALAKVHADLGEDDAAIHFCIEGNWLSRRPYDAARPRLDLSELRRIAATNSFRRIRPGTPPAGPRPVFVVGMPRSGTTLVETILSRHPEVFAGGEMEYMADIERALLNWSRDTRGYTGGANAMLESIPTDFYTRNAAAVLKRVRGLAGDEPFSVFTDKLPANCLRLGLISLVFPNARIIHMRRDPIDCCLSALFLHFARGNGFASSQELLGERYRQVVETEQLWKKTIDLPILDVSYEALVTDPEPMIRRIIDFAGLEWNEACLSPDRAARAVVTSNQYQVRQPINRASVGRARRYEEWIQPLIRSLGGADWLAAERRAVAATAMAAG